eukprot:jgi/Tetstr1/444271/TSEL_032163.t1
MALPIVSPSVKRRAYVIDEPKALAPWAASLWAHLQEAFGSDEQGQRTLDLLSSSIPSHAPKSYAGKLSHSAEFCHDSENIIMLEATIATIVQCVVWFGEWGHIGAKATQPYMSAINTFFELHNIDPIAKAILHLTAACRGMLLWPRRMKAVALRVLTLSLSDPRG